MIYLTKQFTSQLEILVKKQKDGYSKCLEDIVEILCTISFNEISNLDSLITRTKEYSLRKIRIPNKEKKWSKSQGYRLIILCDSISQKVYLLFVYPKKGNLESSDLTSSGAGILLENFISEKPIRDNYKKLCPNNKPNQL